MLQPVIHQNLRRFQMQIEKESFGVMMVKQEDAITIESQISLTDIKGYLCLHLCLIRVDVIVINYERVISREVNHQLEYPHFPEPHCLRRSPPESREQTTSEAWRYQIARFLLQSRLRTFRYASSDVGMATRRTFIEHAADIIKNFFSFNQVAYLQSLAFEHHMEKHRFWTGLYKRPVATK